MIPIGCSETEEAKMPDKTCGYDRVVRAQQQRKEQGSHAAFKERNPTRQKRSKAVQPHSKRVNPLAGALLTLIIATHYGTGVAQEIDSRTGGHIGSFPHRGSRQDGRSGKAEHQRDGRYAKGADPSALERLLSDDSQSSNAKKALRYGGSGSSVASGGEQLHVYGDQRGYLPESEASSRTNAEGMHRIRRSAGSGNTDSRSGTQLSLSQEPQDFIADRVSTIPTRPEMTLRMLLNAGLNPAQNVTVGRDAGGSRMISTMTMQQAALEKSSQSLWMGGYVYPAEIKDLPDATNAFYAYIDSRIEIDSRDLFGIILTDLYIADADLGKVTTVHLIRHMKPFVRASERAPVVASSVGYIFEIGDTPASKRFFAIVPRHKEKMVWSLPTDAGERNSWIRLNRHLFFDDGSFLDVMQEETHDNATTASNVISRRIMTTALDPLKKSRIGRTSFEDTANAVGSWFIPFHDTIDAIKRGAYWEAFTHTAVGLYLEAFAGQGVKQLARAVASTAKGIAKIVVSRIGTFSVRQMIEAGGKAAAKKTIGAVVENTLDEITEKAVAKANRPIEKLSQKIADDIVIDAVEEAVDAVMGGASRTSILARQVDEINDIIIKTKSLADFIKTPTEKCLVALKPVREALEAAGYNTHVRAMEIWNNGMSVIDPERMYPPMNHFVVLAEKGGHTVVVDITAGQFTAYGMSGPIVAPMREWTKRYREASKLLYIRYKDFGTEAQAKGVFGSVPDRTLRDPIPGGSIELVKPRWWNSLDEAIAQAANRKKVNEHLIEPWRKHVSKRRRPARHSRRHKTRHASEW